MGRDKVISVDRHKRSVNKFTSEDRWFNAIGRFIFEFSQLEAILKYYVAQAINLQDRHFNSIMTQDFSILCTIAETVLLRGTNQNDIHLVHPSFLEHPSTRTKQGEERGLFSDALEHDKKLKALIKECRDLNEDRVRIVHGLWNIGEGGGKVHHVSRNSLKDRAYFDQADHLASRADQACSLRSELDRTIFN